MAVLATQITKFTKHPMGNGRYLIKFLYTGPASYTSAGEALTRTVCRAAMDGIGDISFLIPAPAANTTDFSTFTDCAFQPINDGTNVGKFHFYNECPVHNHNLIVKGGQAGSTTNDIANYAGPLLGKQEATDATYVGANSAASGGVAASTASATSSETSAATDCSGLSSWFMGFGGQ